jgi:dephospho-CoA kinase
MGRDAAIVITGPIGSGKSYVADIFSRQGWDVLDADLVGHEVLRETRVIDLISRRWPETVIDGIVDRSILAALVFAKQENLELLERITHPRIQARIDDWSAATTGRRAIEVSALKAILPSWGEIVLIDAPLGIRKERLHGRGLEPAAALLRMNAQPPRRDWLRAAQIVLDNRHPGPMAALRLAAFLDRRT